MLKTFVLDQTFASPKEALHFARTLLKKLQFKDDLCDAIITTSQRLDTQSQVKQLVYKLPTLRPTEEIFVTCHKHKIPWVMQKERTRNQNQSWMSFDGKTYAVFFPFDDDVQMITKSDLPWIQSLASYSGETKKNTSTVFNKWLSDMDIQAPKRLHFRYLTWQVKPLVVGDHKIVESIFASSDDLHIIDFYQALEDSPQFIIIGDSMPKDFQTTQGLHEVVSALSQVPLQDLSKLEEKSDFRDMDIQIESHLIYNDQLLASTFVCKKIQNLYEYRLIIDAFQGDENRFDAFLHA